ncbi:MAG: hypothetical protein PWP62_2285 [Eubacteriaceae bacterium]|nr:hypothetical protein [Eubacteriaceae bacterium]
MKEKLNIAMLGHKRIPSREGGIEIVVEELSTRMVQHGHQVTCYNRGGHHVGGKEFDTDKLNEYKGIRLKQVFTINKKGLAAMTASFFSAILAAFGNYDVVHFHAEGPCVMLWLPKLCGKRCIATIHGLDHQRAKWGKLASAYIMLGEKCAVKYADEMIVLSEGVKSYFETNYGRKTKYISNGVNKPIIRAANLIKKYYGLEKNGYFLFLARLVPEKGAQYLIEAFRQVQTDKKLVIAGGASDTEDYLALLKKMAKGDERIIFTGFVQGEILDELYSNAYVYVLPSDLEGMPLSLLEAMSYGNCCLVSSIPECTEVVEDKAMIFKKCEVEDLKDKIQRLCEIPQIVVKYKSEAADFVVVKYCWDDVTEKTLDLYQKKHS